jgi:3-oxoacyl-[acyl-carrier-protein] synthase III
MRFLAIEHALPSKVITNDELFLRAATQSGPYLSANELEILHNRLKRILKVTGTRTRYARGADENARDIGIQAGELALKTAGLDPSDVDLLIYVGVGRGFLEPSTANVFQDALALHNSTCFDLLDACASWLRALDVARTFIDTKKYRNVMIMNCECNQEFGNLVFRSLDEVDFKFPILTIGEAATATIVTSSDDEDDDVYYATFKSWGYHHTLCQIPLPHYRQFSNGNNPDTLPSLNLYTNGEQLFRVVFKKIVHHYRNDAEINTFKYDIAFSHSASDAFTERVAQVLNLNNAYLTHSLFGNTVSATIPLGMSHAIRQGDLKPGMKVLLGCGSAGVTTAWCRFRYLN